jgi:hypothetical protein
MNLSSQSQTSLTALLSLLNSHSSESFTDRDLGWLFQVPKLADVFNRLVRVALEGSECVLGVDELDVYIHLTMKINYRYESLDDGGLDGKGRARSEDDIRHIHGKIILTI